jgi:hypothetical protein
MNQQSYLYQVPEIAPILKDADHIDVKVAVGNKQMREFAAGLLNYQPGWISFLYLIRAGFVRLLGMRQKGVPRRPHYLPENVPLMPGQKAAVFTVSKAQDERYWVGSVDDNHLQASLGIVVEPLENNLRRFYVITVVHYHNWAGPVYFNIIRPFHHLVVGSMVRAAIK